jgi:flavin reductase (DIM6/NTAB) family NADH-FMN oxidoreductase RutF
MAKQKLAANTHIYPMPVTLLGTMADGKPNFMTLGWITRINFQPPMLAMGVHGSHLSPESVLEHKEFSICHPRADMLELADYVGLVSGKRTDKSGLFTTFSGELENAPMIEECPLCMECRLVEHVQLPSNHLFVGEIVAAYCDENCLDAEGRPDIAKLDPLLLTMPDNGYYRVGEYLGKAWSAGKALKKKGVAE